MARAGMPKDGKKVEVKLMKGSMRFGGLGAVIVLALAIQGRADMLDLRTAGSSGMINGALFSTNDRSPTGTGIIDPFVRIQMNGNEEGYNTDSANLLYDEKRGTWTHSVLLSAIRTIPIGGIDYEEFLLDINEQAGKRSLLSLDKLMIFQESVPDLSVPVGQLASLGTLAYDLDQGRDNWIALEYRLNPGSGWGDMYAYIPTSLFTGAGQYVYLYSAFGYQRGYESGAGFEEWATDPPPPGPVVPLPAAFVLGMLGMGAAGWRLRKFA